METIAALRSEAENLARAMPRLRVKVAASEAIHVGSAGRRRAGAGEHFWQYRQHMPEDGAERIDWRRSARGDTLFVRETELETARTFLFWVDPHAGFEWSGDTDRQTKADRARILSLAAGLLLSKEGERVGILGGRPAGFGKNAINRLCEDLTNLAEPFPAPPKRSASAIIASDFYDPIETWKTRLASLASVCRTGVLLAIADPVEVGFPFDGRTKFSRPGTQDHQTLGRAEAVRDAYHERFQSHRRELEALAASLGWALVTHETDQLALTGAAKLTQAVERLEVYQ